MNKGDIFAVISDGIFESTNSQGKEYGDQRAISIITSHRESSAQEILNALRVDVKEFTEDAPKDDDRTIIIIKRV